MLRSPRLRRIDQPAFFEYECHSPGSSSSAQSRSHRAFAVPSSTASSASEGASAFPMKALLMSATVTLPGRRGQVGVNYLFPAAVFDTIEIEGELCYQANSFI